MEHGSLRPFIRIILAVRLTETNNTEPSDYNYSMFQMNIELFMTKKKQLFITEEPIIKGQFFYLSYWSRKAISTWPCEPRVGLAICRAEATLSFISRYLLAHVQLPFPLTHRLVN